MNNFRVLRCRRHEIEFADAYPVETRMEDAAAALSDCYPTTSKDVESRYVEFMDAVESVVGSANDGVMHDIGCGHGQLLMEAKRRGWQVQGNDIVSGVRDTLQENEIQFWIGNLSELNCKAASCDVVTSFCVLPHHLTHPTPEMNAVWAILKPGGWFILQVPDNGPFRQIAKLSCQFLWPWHPTSFSRFLLANLYGPGGHQFAYTRKNLKDYLNSCGFEVVKVQPYYPSAKFQLARFQSKPILFRAIVAVAINVLKKAGQLLGRSNHSIVFARKARTFSPML